MHTASEASADNDSVASIEQQRRRFLRGVVGFGACATLPGGGALADSLIAQAATLPSGGAAPRYRIVATGLVKPEGPVAMADGSVLVCEMLEGRISRVTPDGKIVPVAQLGGSPNGAAIGPDGACYVANNGGFNSERVNGKLEMRGGLPPGYKSGSIQRIDLKSGAIKTLYTQAGEIVLRGPNDLVFDASGGFYFSDLGKIADGKVDYGAIYWARPDGSEIRQLVNRLLTPNGIALSPDGRTLYVTLSEKRQVLAYNIVEPGKLEMGNGQPRRRVLASIGGDLSFDSMKVEQNGNLVVGTLQVGCLTVFSPAGAMLEQVTLPDTNVTNLAFGGADMKTAFVTLTASDRLAAVPWPRAGMKLNFQA